MQTISHVLLILRVSTFSLESHFLKISLSLPFFNSKFLIGQLSKFVLGSEAEGSKTKEINIVLNLWISMRFFLILYPLALKLKFETGLYWDAILTSFLCEGKSLGIAETKLKHPKSVRRVVGNCFGSHQDAFGNPGHDTGRKSYAFDSNEVGRY